MALKALMLKKKISKRQADLQALIALDAEFERRHTELETSIGEVETEEEQRAVEEEIETYDAELASHETAKTDLEAEIRELEAELEELEKEQEPEEDPEPETPQEEERKGSAAMYKRFAEMSAVERSAFFERDDVKAFLTETRSAIREKRALTNVGLTIPEVMLGMIKENIQGYSKLYKHVNVRAISGEGRMIVMGTIPEGVWTECCANLNELDLSFADVEVNCWKVGGFFAVCNATLEDSDIDLASEILSAIGQAIGLALDKAILYGTGTRMPLGVVTRLAQTSEPADYPVTARTWVDLHTSNIKAINSSGMTAAQLFAAIVSNFGATHNNYNGGAPVWVMNTKTYTALIVQAISLNAAGAIVTGIGQTMPIIGGQIEILDFVPDNVIIGGYFGLYLLAERAGQKFATSEHYRFLADQTVMKGTARYDGIPVIAEGFVAMGLQNTTPNASMSFAPDDANPVESE